VPVQHHPRIHGESKYGFLNRVFWVLYDFFGVAWLRKRYLILVSEEEMLHQPVSGTTNPSGTAPSYAAAETGEFRHE